MIFQQLQAYFSTGKYISFLIVYLQFISVGCNRSKVESYRDDKDAIAAGEKLFSNNCSACHNFKSDGIGPNLARLTNDTSKAYITAFIRDPQKIISGGDTRSVKLISKFRSIMPAFPNLTDEELENILAYLNEFRDVEKVKNAGDSLGIQNPIIASMALSDVCLELSLESQFPPSSSESPKTRITKLFVTKDNSSFYVLDLRGKLFVRSGENVDVYFDIAKERPSFINQPGLATGFGSFAFHPEFAKNGLLYTTHTEAAKSKPADFHYADSIPVKLQWVLTEWKTDKPDQVPFSGKGRELFRMDMVLQLHGVQEITFNPYSRPGSDDYGLLYIGVGDGGCAEAGFPELLTNRGFYLGTVFRIDPRGNNSENGNYGIPSNNPFANDQLLAHRKEVYAYGFRNPHRISWLKSGEMLVFNIGQRFIESLYVVKAGQNHGWPTREGKFATAPGDINVIIPLPEDDSINDISYPVLQYDHDDGFAIAGGYDYQGHSIPLLEGKYVFGDIPTGKVFMTDVAQIRNGNVNTMQQLRICFNGQETTLADLSGSKRVDLHFGRDSMGEIYIMTKPDGKFYKVVGANAIKDQIKN